MFACSRCTLSDEKEEKVVQRAEKIIPAPAQIEPGFASPVSRWKYSADETARQLTAIFDAADLSLIIQEINASHPHVCRDALDTLIKQEVDAIMAAMSSKLGPEVVQRAAASLLRPSLRDATFCAQDSPNESAEALAVIPANAQGSSSVAPVPTEKVPTVIQFGSYVYYASEEKGTAEIDVVRIGNSSGTSSVSYTTVDDSAVAGVKYKANVGVLEFKPHELSKTVSVDILPDDLWDTTVEFQMQISDPKNAQISETLYKCRIKILDDDDFPTNRFKEVYAREGLGGVSKVKLFTEYCKMGLRDPKVRRPAIKCLLFDQVQNLNLVWFLLVKLYLIDVVLNDKRKSNPFISHNTSMLLAVCIAVVVPQFCSSTVSIHRVSLRIGGKSRMKLQSNLLRKFLNYDELLRSAVGLSDLMLSITHHSPELVNNGFLISFDLIQELGKMCLFVCYQVWLSSRNANSGSAAVVIGLAPTVIFPLFMSVFLYIRHGRTDRLKLDMMMQEKHLASQVESVAHNARTIIDYSSRVKTVALIENHIKELNKSVNAVRSNNTFNMQFAPCLACIIVGAYIVFAGHMVLDETNSLSLGTFLVTIDMYGRIAELWSKIYGITLMIHSCLPSLELIFWHMNLSTDLHRRRDLNITCSRMGVDERAKARLHQKDDGVLYAIDMLPIKLRKVSFLYTAHITSGLSAEVSSTVKSQKSIRKATMPPPGMDVTYGNDTQKPTDLPGITNLSLDIQQGSLIAFVGRRGQGKTTLLKILGGVLLPKGDFYMPTHLRVVHVLQQPVFFETTLLHNLCYGVRPNSADGNMERVLGICRSLMVSDSVIELIIADEIHQWDEHLSLTQKTALHLARALIANPDVLVIHKPLIVFDSGTSQVVMKTLKRFVTERGLFVDGSILMRRRRTCIISLTHAEVCSLADTIIEVKKDGMAEVKVADVTNEMMGGI